MSVADPLTTEDAETLERCLRVGGVAVIPTDTVYGLACDPDEPDAFRRLWALKHRDPLKPSAVLFSRVELALAATPWLDDEVRGAIERLLPGAVTVVVDNPEHRFPAAGGRTPERLGIRVPDWPDSAQVLSGLSWPILQSSANSSGGPEIARIEDLVPELRVDCDMVLDAGPLPGTPSSVVDLSRYGQDGSWQVLREGAVDRRTLARQLDR